MPLPRNRRISTARPKQSPSQVLTPETRYSQRMNRVLDHIDVHLDDWLDSSTLAAVANFSSTHFHRMFTAWMGEPLEQYLQRRRLEVAALKLRQAPPRPILHIALKVGFTSGEAFAQAFKQHFALTPSAWRAAAQQAQAGDLERLQQRKLNQAASEALGDNATSPLSETALQVRMVELPPARVAYLRHIGPYGPALGQFWRKTFADWFTESGLARAPRYGVGLDSPELTPPERCRYDACIEIPASFVPPPPAGIATLPGGRYAMAQFRATGAEIATAWQRLFRDWLPGSGQQLSDGPCFEYYPSDAEYDPATGIMSCCLCIPVKPL